MSIRRHTWEQVFEGADSLSRGFGLGASINCCERASMVINMDVVEDGLIAEEYRDGTKQI